MPSTLSAVVPVGSLPSGNDSISTDAGNTQYSLEEGHMDATFIKAKKGMTKWDVVKWGRAPKSWPSQIIEVCHSPLLWKTVLHTNQSWWQAYLQVQAKSPKNLLADKALRQRSP